MKHSDYIYYVPQKGAELRLERKALPTNFLSQRKFDQRNLYFLVKVFACKKKVLAPVLSLH